MTRWAIPMLCLSVPALAQTPAGPSQAALDQAVRLGTVAALAPLCSLRAEHWAFDLRRATILDATGSAQPTDSALHDAPGSQVVAGALSYAETEALESFAAASPLETCEPLKIDPDLARADKMVQAFRMRLHLRPAS